MILIEHSTYNQSTLKANLGAAEHSYVFVRNGFRPVVERLGTRVDVADPAREVDAIYRAAVERGEDCIFLSYNPPHRTTLGLACPTLPIFAWEYDNIPVETWNENSENDWRIPLRQTGMAVTLSREAAHAVRTAMGSDYPVWPVPTPLFDAYARHASEAQGWRAAFDLTLDGALIVDTREVDLSFFQPEVSWQEANHPLRVLNRAGARAGWPPKTMRLEGVVYTAVFNPIDGRKNWTDLVGGFIWAFRETAEATLILKLTHATIEEGLMPVLRHISSLGKMKCRIVVINGLLSHEAYGALVDATSYCVNTSLCEGQCLPLTEYMSAGRPAVAPAHTAMLDYLSPENAFVVRSGPRPAAWPQDERRAQRARNHLISFADLVRQYLESYHVARDEPSRYAAKSLAAVNALRTYCSEDVVARQLGEVLRYIKAMPASSRQVV